MLSRRDDPIPLHALRDMLGIVRSIYAAEKAEGAPEHRLNRIKTVGRGLKDAITMARQATPGTVSHYAAWQAAEKATAAVCDLVDVRWMAQPSHSPAVGQIYATGKKWR